MAGRQCHRCGVTGPVHALDWSSAIEDGSALDFCARCTRRHVRDIESKLAEAWWMEAARSVLVVEDDVDTRMMIRMALESAGCTVDETSTGEAALEVLDHDRTPDVVVADVALGGDLDGWVVCDRLREAGVPVVMISAYWSEDEVSVQRDDVDFLEKPFDPDVLVDLVERAAMGQTAAARA